jgi:ABC-type phosphate/phosphonate transport system ATPase subunit
MKNSQLLESRRDIGSVRGTFEITVKFTQNATWQGQIHWVEKNQKQNFRSALEMLKLMDEALDDREPQP